MLTAEQASERLNASRNPHYLRDQLKRVNALKQDLTFIGQILIQAGPAWLRVENDYPKITQVSRKAHVALGQLRPIDRKKLFTALFPSLAELAETTWALFDRLPYQITTSRRPFRSPGQLHTEARSAWVERLVHATRGFDRNVTWFAGWAPYLGFDAPDALGYLFAAAIDSGGPGGQEVYDILTASANGQHETGLMGRHVTRGLLCASRPEGWAFIERLLLAAQREEGLRQVILESVDEAHPQAFRRLLRLILDHNLVRFSAAVRAFDVWFGLALENESPKKINDLLAQVLVFLDDSQARQRAIGEGSSQEVYGALWALAFEDAQAALQQAISLRQSPQVDRRFAATHLLAQLHLEGAFQELLDALDDPDLRVVARAAANLHLPEYPQEWLEESDLFERLERLIARLPTKAPSLKPLVWDWFSLTLDRKKLTGQLVECLGSRSVKRLIPYLSNMDPMDRFRAIKAFSDSGVQDPQVRQMLFDLVGDPSRYVREQALAALEDFRLNEAEAQQMEDLLKRKAGDLRRGVIRLLLGLPDRSVLQSAERLLGSKEENQRKAGLELLRECVQAERSPRRCRQLAETFQQQRTPVGSEARLLEDILVEDVEQLSLDDALGLMDPHNRSLPKPPRAATVFGKFTKVKLGTRAALEILRSLDQLVEQHRTDPVNLAYFKTERVELLGNAQFAFPPPIPTQELEKDIQRLPLRDLWENWWQNRPASQRDPDGCELLRAWAILQLFMFQYVNPAHNWSEMPGNFQSTFDVRSRLKLHYQPILAAVLKWLIRIHPIQNEIPFLLEALETSIGRISRAELTKTKEKYVGVIERVIPAQKLAYLELCRWHRAIRPQAWQASDHARLWAVVRWLDEPKPKVHRFYPQLEDALFALEAGAATRDDLLDLLLGPRDTISSWNPFMLLRQLSGRKGSPHFKSFPVLKELVDRCRERILSIEIRRGDLPTTATIPAMALRSIPGMKNLMRLVVALGKSGFDRGSFGVKSRQASLSRLIRVTYPLPEDTREGFASLAQEAKISERRLVELASFAPQWAGYVEATLQWPMLEEAVFWVYAHTKDRQWTVEPEIRELWVAQVSEYTPLSADSLMDGAVDVGWFQKVYAALGEAHWQEVYEAAMLSASGKGHMRARLFADALLGKVTPDELIERITSTRHQDSLRALGLAPLPGGQDRLKAILHRYEVIQEFMRTSKKFGSQRQASEKLAATIGLENLARTAGYSDPQRLEWAMEVRAVTDLAEGPVVVEEQGVQVSLAIDELGEPVLTVQKDGKPLKSIPPRVKKAARVASLLERKKQFDRQTSRMRFSLEAAMCRADNFTGSELRALFQHPVLAVMLEQLIFSGPHGMGYPVEGGQALYEHSGRQTNIRPDDELHIVHPCDLLASKEWHIWQHECFIAERIQPFKQVFRELYVLTAAEIQEGNLSRRYAGQQVNPRQALALFGTRGWVADPEEGVHKTFHDAGITARVGFMSGIMTPAEVEDLTLEVVLFTRRGEWSPLNLETIPPRLFSEAMRDLDLVVSVAHAGGVDPEASASSIEARAALVKETCSLLKFQNVEIKHSYALVTGKLGNYTVHLGSAVVHKQPGGSVCIVPVHAQQRGRLFLPFVDNDPKTAEVLSKVILLAKDHQIKDPTILEQILR